MTTTTIIIIIITIIKGWEETVGGEGCIRGLGDHGGVTSQVLFIPTL